MRLFFAAAPVVALSLLAVAPGAPAATTNYVAPANSGCGENGPTMSSRVPTVYLTSATVRLRDNGRARFFLRGTQAAATTVRITQVGGKRVGGTEPRTYTCTPDGSGPDGSGVVSLPINAYGRKLVKRNGRLKVKLVFHLVNGSGVRHTRVQTSVIRPE